MKKPHPDKEIQKRLAAMKHYADKVYLHFGEEDIHQLRVNYKKARAYIRLAKGKKAKLLLPKKLKNLYSAAGNIRDLQLHIKAVKLFFKDYKLLPEHYLLAVATELKDAKEAYKECYKHVSLHRLMKYTVSQIPGTVKRKNIKHWEEKQWDAITRIIKGEPGEEQLHEIRKRLKDLHYTQPLTSPDKDHDHVIDELGDYIDLKVLTSLTDHFINKASAEEKKIFTAASFQWALGKKALREEILKELREMQ